MNCAALRASINFRAPVRDLLTCLPISLRGRPEALQPLQGSHLLLR